MLHAVAPTAELQHVAPLQSRRHRRDEVNMVWIAGQLGIAHRPTRAIVEKLRTLAATAGFPLPKTPRFVKGTRITGPNAIDSRSIWDRDQVERWFEDDRPPTESAAIVKIRKSSVAEQMAERALQLVAA